MAHADLRRVHAQSSPRVSTCATDFFPTLVYHVREYVTIPQDSMHMCGPIPTVVFSGIKKHDGRSFREARESTYRWQVVPEGAG